MGEVRVRIEPGSAVGPESTHGLRPLERYFDEIDTEAKASWPGFILADGCVIWRDCPGTYALSIALQERDTDHLAQLESDIQRPTTSMQLPDSSDKSSSHAAQ